MGHPKLENETSLVFEALFVADEEGRPLFVPVLKASYMIQLDGSLSLMEIQTPTKVTGELWGEPGISSYKYEPQTAFIKPSTDVVLIGSAFAARPGDTECEVRFSLGPLEKRAHIAGDRHWVKSFGGVYMTAPEPFEKIPLMYERAFGGWDRTHPDPDKHSFEPRNPVGTGFRSKEGRFEEGVRLPNIEDPKHLIRDYGDTPPPAGFGFTSPNWQPRASFAGTYDSAWMENRMPLLPLDFDRRFFNAASPGLIAPGYLKGDEPVLIEGASPGSPIRFNLPGIPPPECRVQLVGRRDALVQTKLDTVIVNTDEDLILLLWRGHLPVRNGPHDIVAIQVRAEGVPSPAAVR